MNKPPTIDKLLPHKAPMILVDRVIDVEVESIHCQVDIDQRNIFFDQQARRISAYVGIEFMAQSIAAWAGFHALQRGEPIPIGLLLGCRRYTISCDDFHESQTLDIYAQQVMEDAGMAIFSAQIKYRDTLQAQCQLNVYVPSAQKIAEMKRMK